MYLIKEEELRFYRWQRTLPGLIAIAFHGVINRSPCLCQQLEKYCSG